MVILFYRRRIEVQSKLFLLFLDFRGCYLMSLHSLFFVGGVEGFTGYKWKKGKVSGRSGSFAKCKRYSIYRSHFILSYYNVVSVLL